MNKARTIWALAPVAAVFTALSCAHGQPTFSVGPCPPAEQMKPRIQSFCGAGRSGRRYTEDIHRAVLRSTNAGLGHGFSGLVAISFVDGPRVESVCYSGFGYQLTDQQLDDMARNVGHVFVPSALGCLAGHRFEMTLTPKPEGPMPEVPEHWQKL